VGGCAGHAAASDFLVAGRRLGPALYTGTLSAVVLGGASTIGGVRLGYLYGISGMWLVLMLGLGIIALSVFSAGRLSRLDVYTLPEMLERRYSATGRLVGGIVMTAYDLMVSVTANGHRHRRRRRDRRPARAGHPARRRHRGRLHRARRHVVDHADRHRVVRHHDGRDLLHPAADRRRPGGGVAGLRDGLPDSYFSVTGIGGGTIFTYFFIYFFGIIIGQDVWQRVSTARNAEVARYAGLATLGR
jgi:SSS family solute:Na+ symporter